MSKIIKITVGILVVAVIVTSFFAGYNVRGQVSTEPEEELNAKEECLGLVEQAWDIVFADYVDRDQLDTVILSQGAVRGMLEALDDPYTAFLDFETYQLGMADLEGEFEGIGASMGVRDEKITVIAPFVDSPADKAGIRAGDIILEVDGKSTEEMSLTETVLHIRGAKGTAVTLLVLHEGDSEPVEIEIVRDTIELTSVRFEMREDIAYINISRFSRRTDEELIPVLESIIEEEARGIILDLRSNPGGLISSVVDVASHFLGEGVVVNVVGGQGRGVAFEVEPKAVTSELPIVVLVDNYSASSSEVLSGALQDYHRAVIAGAITYGKGSVGVFRELKDGSGLHITTARWLTPNGYLIEDEGIKPDYELELEGEEAIQWAMDYLRAPKIN